MMVELRRYYTAAGISAVDFDCPKQASCRSISSDFVTAREAFVGSEYERGQLPRVLFVSIDASSDKPGRAPAQRTLEYMRFWEENSEGCRRRLVKTQHWYRTHEFAHCLLRQVANLRGLHPFLLRDIHRYFAHTNSAKCKDAARGNRQGSPQIFANCRPFIAREVELLRPDVLVTQGKRDHEAIDGAFTKMDTIESLTQPGHQCEILRIEDRPVLRFRLYHPRNFGPFNRQRREAYGWYVEVANRFFEGGPELARAATREA